MSKSYNSSATARPTTSAPRRAYPGLLIATFTALICVLLLSLYYRRWPFGDRLDYLGNLIVVAPAVLALVGLGVIWCVRLARALHARTPDYTFVLTPAVVLLAIAVVLVNPRPGFADARDQMEVVAKALQSNESHPRYGVEINGVYFGSIEHQQDGCVYFTDRDRSISTTGWVYTKDCTPSFRSFSRFETVAHNWSRFEYGT